MKDKGHLVTPSALAGFHHGLQPRKPRRASSTAVPGQSPTQASDQHQKSIEIIEQHPISTVEDIDRMTVNLWTGDGHSTGGIESTTT